MVAVVSSLKMPRMRAKHRFSSEMICQSNLRAITEGLYSYRQEHGQFPDDLEPVYDEAEERIDGCLEIMPDPFFGINEERYGADTYSAGYFHKPMTTWSCESQKRHGSEELERRCSDLQFQALLEQPSTSPRCPESGTELLAERRDGFELWCPAVHAGRCYQGLTSVSLMVVRTTEKPRALESTWDLL